MRFLAAELDRLKTGHRLRALEPGCGRDFASNDYLGLARHPELKRAAAAALGGDAPLGATASRLLRGHHAAHEILETCAARFFGHAKALYFGSGFMANFALLSTLAQRQDALILDSLVHASIKEGAHASPAARYRARHNDVASFAAEIARARANGARRIFIAVESLYSMDGDFAPLAELAALARDAEAVLLIDEAHATGVHGPGGRGLAHGLAHGRAGENVVMLHAGGKALGVYGALLCGPAPLIDILVNKARPFVYSTAPPPMLAAALTRALELLEEEPWRREKVLANAALLRGELARASGLSPAPSQIIPVVLGPEEKALAASAALRAQGFDVRAVRPPTVAAGTSRLRVSVHAGHARDEICALATALAPFLPT